MESLASHALQHLPRYAAPLFIRVAKEFEYTGTMKVQKGRLRGEGIELEKIRQAAEATGEVEDAMFWLPAGKSRYVPFTQIDLDNLKDGVTRL